MSVENIHEKLIDQQIKHFNSTADRYFLARKNANHLLFKKLLWSFFFSNKDFIFRPNLNILEPMCGYTEGKNALDKCLGIQFNYTGFDFSKNVIKKLKSINPNTHVFL